MVRKHERILNADKDMKDCINAFRESIREAEKVARGKIFNQYGFLVWEEPLEEYEQRLKELNK